MIESIDQTGRENGHEKDKHAHFFADGFLQFVQIFGHSNRKVICLMSVIPTDILSENTFEKKSSNPVNLALSRMVQTRHKYVGHDKVD